LENEALRAKKTTGGVPVNLLYPHQAQKAAPSCAGKYTGTKYLYCRGNRVKSTPLPCHKRRCAGSEPASA